jgi:hypothetical protein
MAAGAAARLTEGTQAAMESVTSSPVVIADQGLLAVEVIDPNDNLVGAALIAVGSGFAGVLASAGTPTFTAGSGSVTVGSSGGSRRVRWRRICATGSGISVMS